ncbi:phosphotransferase [Arthrobacter sp. LAR12-1-1.1]
MSSSFRSRRIGLAEGEQVWIHTDLQPGNLMIADARLAGVLDWGGHWRSGGRPHRRLEPARG